MTILFYLNTFTNVIAVCFVFFGASNPHIMREESIIKTGALLACFGLLGQSLRNIQFLVTGESPTDADLPFWMLKDLGLFLMIYGYAMRGAIGDKFKGKK